MILTEHKCKNCGADLDITTAVDGVIECPWCFSKFTVSKTTDNKALDFLRMGEHDIDTCKFDDAYIAYQKAAECDKTEPEAFFGMALAEFKVQYLKDMVNNRLQPICHDVSQKQFTQNKNFKQAFALATAEQKKVYVAKAKEIEYIRSEFYKLQQSGLDYDCFICVKVTGEGGRKTEDSDKANDIYYYLKDKGYKPFYSEREVQNKTGADYEATILYALHSSECMIVVCDNEDYLKTPWVRNEYTRFISLMGDEQKDNDAITIAFLNKPIERLPGRNGKIQGICLNKPDAYAKICDFVEVHTPIARAQRQEAAKVRQREADEIRKQIELQKQSQRELELQLERLSAQSSSGVDGTAVITVGSLLTRGEQELSTKNFEKARSFFERVLDSDPNNAAAWWGLFLVDFSVPHEDKITINTKAHDKIISNVNYVNANKHANGKDLSRISKFNEKLFSAPIWWDLFCRDIGMNDDDIEGFVRKTAVDKLVATENNENLSAALSYADEEWREFIGTFIYAVVEKSQAAIQTYNKDIDDNKNKQADCNKKIMEAKAECAEAVKSVPKLYRNRVGESQYDLKRHYYAVGFWGLFGIFLAVVAITALTAIIIIGYSYDVYDIDNPSEAAVRAIGITNALLVFTFSGGFGSMLFVSLCFGVLGSLVIAIIITIIRKAKYKKADRINYRVWSIRNAISEEEAKLTELGVRIKSLQQKIADCKRYNKRYNK